MKQLLKNIFRLTTTEELENKVTSFSYEDVNNILRWNRKLVNHIYSHSVTESDEDNVGWTRTTYYTLLDIVDDEHMERLLRHWGAKTFSELEEEKEVLRRKEEEAAQKEKLAAENRKKNGKAIVDRLLGC